MTIRTSIVVFALLLLLSAPSRADEYYLLNLDEIVADNVSGITDEAGDHDPWVELHNGRSSPANPHDLYLTDDLADPMRWPLPEGALPPNSRTVIWLDGEPVEGSWHTSFRADPDGGMLAIYDAARGEFIEQVAGRSLHYGPLGPDAAFGVPAANVKRVRDLIIAWLLPTYLAVPTPGAVNAPSYLTVVLNEVLADGVIGTQAGFVEVRNGGSETVDIGSWSVTADHDPLATWSFPAGTQLAPNAYLAVPVADLGFAVEATGTFLVLTRPQEPRGVDAFPPVAFPSESSWGRIQGDWPDGPWAPSGVTSPGGPNHHPTATPEAPPQGTARLISVVPNPFNPSTTIRFDLPVGGRVSLAVYDVAGRLLRTLSDVDLPAGGHQAAWDGRDSAGRGMASGSYFARLVAGGKMQVVRMSLVR